MKYRHLLHMFANSHGEDMQRVQAQLANGNIREAQQLAHGLKGVAGLLGASRVAELATHLDIALHRNATFAECTALAQKCQDALSKLILGILSLPEEAIFIEKTESNIDSEHLRQMLNELKNLLVEHNARANYLAKEYADLLRTHLGSDYAQFTYQIDRFDYEEALKTLQMPNILGVDTRNGI